MSGQVWCLGNGLTPVIVQGSQVGLLFLMALAVDVLSQSDQSIGSNCWFFQVAHWKVSEGPDSPSLVSQCFASHRGKIAICATLNVVRKRSCTLRCSWILQLHTWSFWCGFSQLFTVCGWGPKWYYLFRCCFRFWISPLESFHFSSSWAGLLFSPVISGLP